ncbi:MAG: hypothetical protein C4B59_05820 [Candidatus Methanogaster sp.]|uniref:Uncharacterized protein n=1 Tax=Candidatus Methanogaster sp. TaxID=3386292 RepID=A0AC61L3Q0_9EURY|nr:MAG: hypothetical protein C4B59_05820 [ANME-2 cluster archaeon]
MSATIDLSKIEKKAYRDSQQDGIMELVIGLFLVIMVVPQINLNYVFLVLLLPPMFTFIIERLRKRYSYPRIGYVKLHTDPPKETAKGIFTYMIAVLVVVAIISFIISGDMAGLERCVKWSPAFVGFTLVGAFHYMASKSGSVRFHLFAVVSATLGFILSMVDFDSEFNFGVIIYLLIMGGLLVISGIVRFIRFLHMYPLPEKEVSDVNTN